jgi:hypothetical protein
VFKENPYLLPVYQDREARHMTDSSEETLAYQEAQAQRTALQHQLFELMVKEEWFGMLGVVLRDGNGVTRPYKYFEAPDFSNDERGYHYVGCWKARDYKSEALGERLSDEQFAELVQEVLQDELDKYNVELRLTVRHNWDGSDKVFCVLPKSAE